MNQEEERVNCLARRAQAVFAISYFALPAEFTGIFTDEPERVVKNWYMFFCVAVGLWGGLVIGIVTEYFTSNRYQPVQARAPPASAAPGCLHGPADAKLVLPD